ncbi:MAG: prolipoprotein diacylglyceryl transferase [Chloroflexi bacterium]|nr:prolipoprotein diacylglyceryl transferase [Chloroflexota bacterium]
MGDSVITIGLDPNIHLGPLTLAWHGIFTAVGIFFGVWLPVRLLHDRVPEDRIYHVATWGVVAGIIGARLFHVIDRWDFYATHPELIPAIWTGGIAVWGSVFGGLLGGFIAARRVGFPIGGGADAAAPGIALGFAIGRIGDIINGEHHSIACSGLPWCVGYSFPAEDGGLGQIGPVHPAVAYELIYDAALVGLSLLLRRFFAGRVPEGRIFWIWTILYGFGRFLISFLRIDDPAPLLNLRQDQIIGLIAMIAGVVMLAYISSRSRATRVRLPA